MVKTIAVSILAAGAILTAQVGAGLPDQLPLPPSAPESIRPRVAPADLMFDTAISRASLLPRLKSLLVSVDGELVEEHYFNDAAASRAANLKSASKSLISILVGIAIDRGHLESVHAPIGPFFSQYLQGQPDKSAITVEDLLTMRSGLETTSNRNYGAWVLSGNWVRHILQRPFVDEPGGRMIYSTGSTHLLSAILTRATGQSTLDFARDVLARPLGITLRPWPRDPQGIFFGGNDMLMTPRDMLTVGELYLNEGRHGDRQIVPESWVRASTEPRTRSPRSQREYGYGWWTRTLAGYPVFYAWGYGGQFIFVVPDLRTVVVTTSVSDPGSERREHLGALYDLVEQDVIPVVVGMHEPVRP